MDARVMKNNSLCWKIMLLLAIFSGAPSLHSQTARAFTHLAFSPRIISGQTQHYHHCNHRVIACQHCRSPATLSRGSSYRRQFSTRHKHSASDHPPTSKTENQTDGTNVPLYRSEGLFAVVKPMDWTSSDVVSFIRKILERDARERGAEPAKIGRKNKSRQLKVGHGGTLDPLATGVLVIGVGKGTKELQSYLSGSKGYIAGAQFGFETTTLDMDKRANITKTAPYEHISMEDIENLLPSFEGKIQQVPPIFSAIKKGGKKLYEKAREGTTAEDLALEAREVQVYKIALANQEETTLPSFELEIECGGGTYVRSLIRDIAYKLDTVATMTSLERAKQAQFTLDNALPKSEWSPDSIFAAIDKVNHERED